MYIAVHKYYYNNPIREYSWYLVLSFLEMLANCLFNLRRKRTDARFPVTNILKNSVVQRKTGKERLFSCFKNSNINS